METAMIEQQIVAVEREMNLLAWKLAARNYADDIDRDEITQRLTEAQHRWYELLQARDAR